MTSQRAVDNVMYSATVVDKAVSVWSFDPHDKGYPANRIMYPIQDLAVANRIQVS